MIAPALLAIVVHTGAASVAPTAARTPHTVVSRRDTSTTGARRLRLLVRIDSHAVITDLPIGELRDNIREIWRPRAEIDFAEVGVEAAATYDDELRLVITDGPARPGSADAAVLGWIEFVDGRPRTTVTVSMAAARTLMSRSTWLGRPIENLPPSLRQRFVTRALSRSAAHEIGHYLLRSSAHATRGLMRARMTAEEIMDDTPALYRLLPSEIARLDQRLAGALAEAPASDPRPTLVPLRDRKS